MATIMEKDVLLEYASVGHLFPDTRTEEMREDSKAMGKLYENILCEDYQNIDYQKTLEKIKSIITEILKTVIQDGKGIEINTSSHRYGLKDSTPSRDILKLYKELGGKIITIGSDSHKPEHLGAYIDEAKELLKEIGFDSFCTFEKMKPIFHQL